MNFKELLEKRNELVEKMNGLFSKAEAEKRSLTEEEVAQFDAYSKEVKGIDTTMKLGEEARSYNKDFKASVPAVKGGYEAECRAFASFVRENRADWTVTANGAVIPTTIAAKIVETVENICPIYSLATKYRVKGDLVFPKYDETSDKVQMGYASEFGTLTAHAGAFGQVTLKGFLAASLTLVSRSLINNVQFDLTAYVITKVAEAVARFLEHELLLGAGGSSAMQGCVGTNTVNAASAGTVDGDDLIALQMEVPDVYQANACWIMNKKTLMAIRELKDTNDHYLLQQDIRQGFGYVLLGKPVHISDNMADIGSSGSAALPIVYGDFSGVYVNIHEDVTMQVLQEQYATQHAIGVVTWLEADADVVEPQKIATLSA